ncbi:MAG: hypothetical protein CTY15_02295 [Methylocystis sp.]|nr:MAG: hypothetical protein CTY15_02295 [Methylocystis sp.]
MSKYAPLTDFLRSRPQRELRCRFSDIEKTLGFSLPPVARAHRAWWSNNASNNVMTKAWLNAGFRAEQVDMAGESLVFRRVEESPPSKPEAAGGEIDNMELIGRVLDVLRGDTNEAAKLRHAIIAALPGTRPISALDLFSSDLPEEAFDAVFPEKREGGWREIDL